MDEPTTPQVAANAPAADDDNQAGLTKILEALVPEAGVQVVWRDVAGGVHRAPTQMPIRTQALVAARIRDEWSRLSGINMGDGGSIVAALADPAVLMAAVGVFEILHPMAVIRARASFRDHPELLQESLARAGVDRIEDLGAADLFAGEELVDAVLPFCAGPLLKMLRMATQVG